MGTRTRLVIAVCSIAAVVGSVQGLFRCEDGWTRIERKCYKVGDSIDAPSNALDLCPIEGAILWRPENAKENNQALNLTEANTFYAMDIGSSSGYWQVNRSYSRQLDMYSNFQRSPDIDYRRCGVFNGGNGTWSMVSCSVPVNYICVKKSFCAEGYFGKRCDNECHCDGRTCDVTSGVCSGGCRGGWSGHTCSLKMAKAYGMFYCMEKPGGSKEVIFRANVNNVNYRHMIALDKGGKQITSCGKNQFDILDSTATITFTGSGSSFEPDCGARMVNNDTTKWQLLFRQYMNISSKYDVIFQITCNWEKAEKRQQSVKETTKETLRHQEAEHLHLEQTRVNARVKLVEADSGEQITNATIGERVKLVVDFQQSDDLGVADIAPYSCMASSVDGSQSLPLTDQRGCPVNDAPVYLDSMGNKHNGSVVYTSKEFEAFSFPGQKHVVFSCQIETCFLERDPRCHYRCHRLPQKKKRSVKEADHQTATTVVDIWEELDPQEPLAAGI